MFVHEVEHEVVAQGDGHEVRGMRLKHEVWHEVVLNLGHEVCTNLELEV